MMAGKGGKRTILRTEENGYDPVVDLFWVADPLTDEEYAQAEANGVSKKTAYQRRHVTGWSKEKTINHPVRRRRNQKEILAKYRERMESLGMEESLFIRRVFIEDHEPEEVLSDPKLYKARPSVRKKKYKFTPEQLAIAAKNGISRHILVQRMREGGRGNYTIERAITEPVGSHPKARRNRNENNFERAN